MKPFDRMNLLEPRRLYNNYRAIVFGWEGFVLYMSILLFGLIVGSCATLYLQGVK
jgi:hypothetical protein